MFTKTEYSSDLNKSTKDTLLTGKISKSDFKLYSYNDSLDWYSLHYYFLHKNELNLLRTVGDSFTLKMMSCGSFLFPVQTRWSHNAVVQDENCIVGWRLNKDW